MQWGPLLCLKFRSLQHDSKNRISFPPCRWRQPLLHSIKARSVSGIGTRVDHGNSASHLLMRSCLASHTHLNLLSLFFVLDFDLGAQLHIPARRDGHLCFRCHHPAKRWNQPRCMSSDPTSDSFFPTYLTLRPQLFRWYPEIEEIEFLLETKIWTR